MKRYTLSDLLVACAYAVLFTSILGMAFAACERDARADVPLVTHGPTVPFFHFGQKPHDPLRLNLGNDSDVGVFPAGLGWMAAINPPKLCKGDVCYLSFFGAAFANLAGLPAQGGLILSLGVAFYNNLVGLGCGYKAFELYQTPGRPMEGLFAGGNGGARNVLLLLHVSVNLDLSKVPTPSGVSAPPPRRPNFWRP